MIEAKKFAEDLAAKSFVEGTSCELSLVSWRYPMEIEERNMELLDRINEIFISNGIPKHEFLMSNGGSDAADISHYGIPCVDDLGVIGNNIHSVRESAILSSLKESAKMLSLIALNI